MDADRRTRSRSTPRLLQWIHGTQEGPAGHHEDVSPIKPPWGNYFLYVKAHYLSNNIPSH